MGVTGTHKNKKEIKGGQDQREQRMGRGSRVSLNLHVRICAKVIGEEVCIPPEAKALSAIWMPGHTSCQGL